MAATSILSTDAEMLAMAGENVDATGFTDANKTAWGIQAENFLDMLTNYDLVTNVATLGANFKMMLSEYVARYVGLCGAHYNPNSYTTILEFEDLVNIHAWRMEKIERILMRPEHLALLGVS